MKEKTKGKIYIIFMVGATILGCTLTMVWIDYNLNNVEDEQEYSFIINQSDLYPINLSESYNELNVIIGGVNYSFLHQDGFLVGIEEHLYHTGD